MRGDAGKPYSDPLRTGNVIPKTGIASGSPGGVFDVQNGSGFTVTLQSSTGSCRIYTSNGYEALCKKDIADNNFSGIGYNGTGATQWTDFVGAAVTATYNNANWGKVTCIAVVPTSGTWAIEACQ